MIPANHHAESYWTRWFGFLNILVSVTFVARGWLTYRWDSPIRGLLWNEEFFAPVVQRCLGLSWQDYAANSDQAITGSLEICGIILMVSAIVPWLPIRKTFCALLILPAILILSIDTFARFVESGFQFGMLIEHALQVGIAFAWLTAHHYRTKPIPWIIWAKVLVALTFVGHGLYAVGLHPVPWSFQSMTRDLLGLSEPGALLFLRIVGCLDFVVAVAMFIRPIEKPVLAYIIFWGAVTALARIASNPTAIDPWFAENLVRTVHWGIPLLILKRPDLFAPKFNSALPIQHS